MTEGTKTKGTMIKGKDEGQWPKVTETEKTDSGDQETEDRDRGRGKTEIRGGSNLGKSDKNRGKGARDKAEGNSDRGKEDIFGQSGWR